MRLLLDENVDPAVARDLRGSGIDVVAVPERPELRGRSDEVLLDVAADERRVLVTRDVSTLRSVLRARWAAGRATWGAIFVSSSIAATLGTHASLADALSRIATAHPTDGALEHEVWIAAASS